jgi:hypothetical protein
VNLASHPLTATVSAFDAAAPFIVNCFFLIVGPFVGLAVVSRLSSMFRSWLKEGGISIEELPIPLDPEVLANTATWTIDASQILTLCLSPLVGLLLVFNFGGLGILYAGSLAIAICGFLGFTFATTADRYPGRFAIWIFTPVTVGGLVLNVAAAVVAASIAPGS